MFASPGIDLRFDFFRHFSDIAGHETEGRKERSNSLLDHQNGPIAVHICTRAKKVGTKKYTIFEVADYSGGNRKLRSFSEEAKAREEAERIAEELRAGDTAALQLDGNSSGVA